MPQERKARRSAYADGGLSFKSRKFAGDSSPRIS